MRVQKAPPTPNVRREMEELEKFVNPFSMREEEKLMLYKYLEGRFNWFEGLLVNEMSKTMDAEEKYQELWARACLDCRFRRRSKRLAEMHGVPPPPVHVAAPGGSRKRPYRRRPKGEVEVVKEMKRVSNKDKSIFGHQQLNASANRSQSPLAQSQVINPNLPPVRLPPTHVTLNILPIKDEPPEDDYLEQGPSSYGTQVDNIPPSPVLASAHDEYSTFGTDLNYFQVGSEALDREATMNDDVTLNITSPSTSFSDASQSPIPSPNSSGKVKERRQSKFNISFKSCKNLNNSFSSSQSFQLFPPPDYNAVMLDSPLRRGTTGQSASPSFLQTPRSYTPTQAFQPNRSSALAGIEFFDQQFFTA